MVFALLSPRSFAENAQRPGLLLGGSLTVPESAPANIDPALPTGALIRVLPRPSDVASTACALDRAVCVHVGRGVDATLIGPYLAAFESARRRIVGVLGLPAPLDDVGLGPGPGLDLYLSAAHEAAPTSVEVVADPRIEPDDRTSAHCRAQPSLEHAHRQAATCVAEATLLGIDAGETPQLRGAIASYLRTLVGPIDAIDLAALDDAQANPHLSVVARDRQASTAAAELALRHIDAKLGAGRPGLLPAAMAQMARGTTPFGALRWQNEPDAFDVLRAAFTTKEQSFADFWLGFATERAFLGSRDDGRHAPALLALGRAGRVRFEWVIPASTLPRRVAPRRPLEPLGSAYVWLVLDRVTLGKTLAFRAEWEAPTSFRWRLVAVDAAGKELERYELPDVQNATTAERTFMDQHGAAAILVVGTNMGGVDLAHPFDPDHEPFEPHGFTVYLAEI